MMALTPEQKRRLIQAANQERVDPGELIREAEAMATATVEQMIREGKRVVVLMRRRSDKPERNTCVVRVPNGS